MFWKCVTSTDIFQFLSVELSKMVRTFYLPANSSTADLEDVVRQIRTLPRRTQVLVRRGTLTLNDGTRMRRDKAAAFFAFMCTVLDVVAARGGCVC
jgi:hypothetical protein